MKKHLFLLSLLLFFPAINAMENDPPAKKKHKPEFSQEVIERAQKTNLIKACQDGDIEVVRYLIANGANVNQAGTCKPLLPFAHFTPLYVAADYGRSEIFKLLISQGADVNKVSYGGKTPLHKAARYDSTELCQLLIAQGADVNKATYGGKTPLHKAVRYGSTELYQLLIAQGADVNQVTYCGKTPLHKAAAYGKTDIVRLLAEIDGANIDQTDNDGCTPLHWAARNGHTQTCQLLLQLGAQVNQTDNNGCTPLHWAAYQDQTEVLFLLLSQQANLNITDKHGKTPLDYGNSSALIKEYDKQLKSTLKMRCLETILDKVENKKEVLEHLHKIKVPLEVIDNCPICCKQNVVTELTNCCNKKICHQCWDSCFQEETTSNIQLVHDPINTDKIEKLRITLHGECPLCKKEITRKKTERVAHTIPDDNAHTNE